MMMLAAALLAHAASVIDGGDFEIPRVTMHRKYRPQFPWSSLHTAVAPYQQVDGSAACSAQRQFLVCKRNRCWVNVRVRTQPGRVYRVRYSVDEQVFDGCVPAHCATLASAPKPVECLPCDKPHGVNIDGDERVADEVIGAQQCEVVPVFKQMQLDFVAQGLDTSITWFPKNVSANPRGNFKLDRVSVFQVCGSDLIPVDETLDGPGREFCPPTAAPTPAPPSQAPTQQPTAQPSTGSPSVPPSTGAPSAAPSAPSATPSAPLSAASTVSSNAPAAAAPLPPTPPPSGAQQTGLDSPRSSPPTAAVPSGTVAATATPYVAPRGPVSGSAVQASQGRSSGLTLVLACGFAALAVGLGATVLWCWRARKVAEYDAAAATELGDDARGPDVESLSSCSVSEPPQAEESHAVSPTAGSGSECSDSPSARPRVHFDLPQPMLPPPNAADVLQGYQQRRELAPPPLPIQEPCVWSGVSAP